MSWHAAGRWQWRAALIPMLACLATSGQALAGAAMPCSNPFAFADAAVNVVVLPFQYDAGDAHDGAQLGEQLSSLVQAEILLSMLKYGSVGAIRLYSVGHNDCQARSIVDALTHGSHDVVQPGNGLVVVWGRIYVEGEQIYLQTYVRFLRRDAEDTIQVMLSGGEGVKLVLDGRLPAQAVAAQPRMISRQDLVAVATAFRTNLVVRPKPDDSLPGKPLDLYPGAPFMYSVVASSGDWMKIEPRPGISVPAGWIRARADANGWSLRKFLPELAFVDAVVGYERVNAKAAPHDFGVDRIYGWVTTDLKDYQEAVGSNASPLINGLGLSLRGFLLWNTTPTTGSSAGRREAAGLFRQTLDYIPQYVEARNLATITQPYLAAAPAAVALNTESMRQLDTGLLGALAVGGRNGTVLGNLDRLYAFALAQPGTAQLYPDLETRLATVRSAAQPKQ